MLINRQYPTSLINYGIEKAKSNVTTTSRIFNTTEKMEVIPYVSTYNPRNSEAFNIIHENIPSLMQNPKMKDILDSSNIIKSKRQPKSLKKILTKAEFNTNTRTPSVSKCGRSNCGICQNMKEGSDFYFKNGQYFKVKNSFTCSSENLIYVLTCAGCNKNYIGQTGMSLRKRMTVHRQQIRDPTTRKINLSEHLDNCARNKLYSER